MFNQETAQPDNEAAQLADENTTETATDEAAQADRGYLSTSFTDTYSNRQRT